MNRLKIVTSSIVISGLMCANASSLKLEEQIKKEQKEEMHDEQYIKGQILKVKVVDIGEDTVLSLKANLDFINKIEKDPKFRDCIVLKGGVEKIEKLKKGAKELYQQGKVTKSDYTKYINTLDVKKAKLTQKITNQCRKD